MKTISRLIIMTALVAIDCLLPCYVSADILPQVRSSAEYKQAMERINAIRASNDSVAIKAVAQQIQREWVNADPVQYSEIMDNLCYTVLFSRLGNQDEKSTIVEKYALLALARKEEMPVLIEADLVGYLQPQEYKTLFKNTLSKKNWTDYRKARASIALHLLGRINTQTDPNFDFSGIRIFNDIPPTLKKYPSGILPETVSDPKLRAEYEAYIKAEEAFRIKNNEQLALKQLNQFLVPLQQKYVVDLYSVPPYNLAELKALLNKYPLDAVTKQKIVDQVTTNTTPAK